MKYEKLRPYQSPWYRICTKAMVISKGSYGHGDSKNVFRKSVQPPYLPLRGSKVPRFMGGSIGPRMEICETSALPIPMVPGLHQSNGYIKRNLRAWRVQIPYLALRSRKLPRFIGGIRPRMEICGNSGLHIPMVPRLHKSNGYMKRKLRAWRVQKCIALVGANTVLTSSGPETTPFYGRKYRAQNGNMRNLGPTNPHGTVFAPKQWLYKKEAMGIESSKMYCPSWCRYRTYHCVAAKHPVSWGVV